MTRYSDESFERKSRRMKRIKIFVCVAMMLMILLSGCDGCVKSGKYKKAIIQCPNGEVIETEIESYEGYMNSTIKIKDINGNIYRTHCDNVLIVEVNDESRK